MSQRAKSAPPPSVGRQAEQPTAHLPASTLIDPIAASFGHGEPAGLVTVNNTASEHRASGVSKGDYLAEDIVNRPTLFGSIGAVGALMLSALVTTPAVAGTTATDPAELTPQERTDLLTSTANDVIGSGGDSSDVEAAIEDLGFEILSVEDPAAPLSTNQDVTMGSVVVAAYGGPIGGVSVVGTYQWNSGTALLADGSSTDVFGVSWTSSSVVKSISGEFCGYGIGATCQDLRNPESANGYGVAYSITGLAKAHHGTVAADLQYGSCPLQGFSRYEHAWQGRELTGIGIGPGSISVSWSSTGHSWSAAQVGGTCS